ncbi:MAG: cyclic pyranopterin monophosphate synthase MoaC [candidate division Zixibacteria bacterium]|nr:cyclic pyranopterin monophosphate synthase MoaC [candidate division Zixibacteria bacterium]
MGKLTHVNSDGKVVMVDVGDKPPTQRLASGSVEVHLNQEAFEAAKKGSSAKGDILCAAKLAGIQAAKRTSELIPLCHQIPLDHVEIEIKLIEDTNVLLISSIVKSTHRTGVEMEALTACSVAALTVYDMLKAVQRDIKITNLVLQKKQGGLRGDYVRQES